MLRKDNNGKGVDDNVIDTRAQSLSRVNEERMAYAMSRMVGRDVLVNMSNGKTIKGRFHSYDGANRQNNRGVDIALQNARTVENKDDKGHGRSSMVVQGSDYNYVVANGVNAGNGSRGHKTPPSSISRSTSGDGSVGHRRQGGGKFKTDGEISKSKGQRQNDKLVAWKSEGPVDESQLYILDNQRKTAWDQFESNRKAFGLESTYNENIYTTELNLSEVPQKVQEEANKIAAEIAGPHGHGGYSQLETYLEQDDDTGGNPAAEVMVKKSLARNMRDNRRDDRMATTPKIKSRPTGPEPITAPPNARSPGSNRVLSYKDVMANGSASSTQQAKQQPNQHNADQNNNAHYKHHIVNHDGMIPPPPPPPPPPPHSPSRSEYHHGKTDGNRQRIQHGDHVGDKPIAIRSGEKGDDKSSNKYGGHDTKPVAPATPTDASTPPKKTFAFNPNASSFTPIAAMHSSVRPVIPGAHSPIMTPMNHISAPLSKRVTNEAAVSIETASPSRAKEPSMTPSRSHSKFHAFSPMIEYPKLDISSYTAREWPQSDTYFDEAWANCSEMSYRSLLGDIGMIHHVPSVVAMRPQHALIPPAGMATVLLPQGTPVTYPAYQIGGIPVNVVPYARQLTPKFYTSPRHAQHAMHTVAATRRPFTVNPTQPSTSHTRSSSKQKPNTDGNKHQKQDNA
ncbi:ataxin-2 N-terminal region domain containing protein, putative [Babesia ovis]|uniref:Ataxin-2 N-terminal region domain containing protein, putative n=1 Tax=Babesia ovis TaxID=5869 RepID=A0A9W5T9E4_BABOV|nr:ataxin-2 N-terminal region domain containing protein, putative [Babesia ovis]